MSMSRRVVAMYASAQFVRFVLVGGIALAFHWLSRFILNSFVGYAWAIVLAYGVGIAVGFMLNKNYVFPYSDRPLSFEISAFVLVNLVAFPFVWVIAYVLGEWILQYWFRTEVAFGAAHAIAIALPVFANFAFHKFITFRLTRRMPGA
jgi:putative flippase GtrA